MSSQRFKPVYMPIMDVMHNRMLSLEALLRVEGEPWGHIKVLEDAERTGDIVHIDIWMLKQAANFLRQMPYRGSQISINVSPVTIDHFLSEYLSVVMQVMDVGPSLIFEVTETQPVLTLAKVNTFSQGVKLVGGKVSLDDFGEGHFLTLDLLPETDADYIKLSQTFMEQAYSDPAALSGLLERLPDGCELIAEHIDSVERLKFLVTNSIRYAQGFLFSKPISIFTSSNTPFTEQLVLP